MSCPRKIPANGERAGTAPFPGGAEPAPIAPVRSENDWLTWQLADSAFPTGGFAHSNGLEAACHNGAVAGAAGLFEWIAASLTQLAHGSLPFMTACHREPSRFAEVDGLCDSFILNHVANRASRAQGKALVAAARAIYHVPEPGGLGGEAGPGPPCFHLAPVFGAVIRAVGMEREQAARLFLFLHLRGAVGSAVRLGVVGPLEAQSLQHRLAGHCEALLPRSLSLGLTDIAQTAPLLDLWQGTQDRLYSRLFQS